MQRFQTTALRFGAVALLGSGLAVSGCATAGSISPEQEAQLGAQYSAEINQQLPIVQNSAVHSYINQLGRSIANRVDQRLNYTFYVVNADEVNAFAVPGGYIYVNRGLIERAETMSELAGVLGHEIGHVTARHSAQQYTRQVGGQLGLAALGIFVPAARPFGELSAQALGLLFLKYGREDELQADSLGARYAAAASWDPAGVTGMLATLGRLDAAVTGDDRIVFRYKDRIAEAEAFDALGNLFDLLLRMRACVVGVGHEPVDRARLFVWRMHMHTP